jgi:hypothetical protein
VQLLLPDWEEYLAVAVNDLLPWAAPFPMVIARIRLTLFHLVRAGGSALSRPGSGQIDPV